MTNKEAIEILTCRKVYGSSEPEKRLVEWNNAICLAIKALEIVDDVNHKIYRNENCPQKDKCYDYQGYHCSGCSWEARKNE